MNNNKKLRPNLLDPILEKKIIKTLKPPKEDYWAPTKNIFQNIYQNYIRPNVYLIIIIVIICLILLYRYRMIRNDRAKKIDEMNQSHAYNHQYLQENFQSNIVQPVIVQPAIVQPSVAQQNSVLDQYANMVLNVYNEQKEESREPRLKKINERMKPAKIKGSNTDSIKRQPGPRFAYPIYPYAKGGILTPAGRR